MALNYVNNNKGKNFLLLITLLFIEKNFIRESSFGDVLNT